MNILAVAICLIALLAIFFLFTVYKAWYLNVLEASFIINVLLLAIGTNYVEINLKGTRLLSPTLQLVLPLLRSVA